MDTSIVKTALVTGAGQRLGQILAIELGRMGYQVVVHYNSNSSGAEQTVKRIHAENGKAVLVQANLSNENETDDLISRTETELGNHIGLLINNASTFVEDDILSQTQESWDRHMSVNLRAPVLLAQRYAQALPESARGLVINMIDQRVWKLNPTFFTYTLSKSALWTATKTMAQGLAPRIRVNAIGPGPTMQNARQEEKDFQKQVTATLTQRGSSPEEIVKAMRFIIDADALTGQMLAMDGGQHLIWQTPDVVGVIE